MVHLFLNSNPILLILYFKTGLEKYIYIHLFYVFILYIY